MQRFCKPQSGVHVLAAAQENKNPLAGVFVRYECNYLHASVAAATAPAVIGP